jgi:hypothetical protein
MTRDQFLDDQLWVSVTAGMNQQFHQTLASFWTWCNRFVQIAVACLAVTALCLSFTDEPHWIERSIAALAAAFAIALNVLPLGDWVQEHYELFRRWTDLREEIDDLQCDGDRPKPAAIEDLRKLRAKVHRIGAAESGLGVLARRLLKKCEIEEKKRRADVKPDCIPTLEPARGFARLIPILW